MSHNQPSRPLKVVAVSGSLHAPSKTTALVGEILAAFGREIEIDAHLIEVNEIGPEFAGALRRDQVSARVEAELQRIEGADLLVVASPVYRASFTGLFKHLFDFVGQYALVDTPVLLAATGGSDRHALIIEHQFRPLFGFFQALTLPIGVYASDNDFTEHRVTSLDLQERIDLAVSRALPLIRLNVAEADSIARYLQGQ
ncbi:FMN reductase [Microbacterium sp. STN6]|uniref:FMN reductase n=1 Tax=Microbacterium sp. STN6 TaxID=2995588 RepID=UPI00226083B3|nr:FMN reductase [Microbacterium sp. STN6]MCX7521739.1 FMN reductase [Microbacterium sp. STN6]